MINGFQSTLPTRGSDRADMGNLNDLTTFQSTLPTRGSDVVVHIRRGFAAVFQSTLPTRGSDGKRWICRAGTNGFQSTLPTRGSDDYVLKTVGSSAISIHAPHEGERHARRKCEAYADRIISIHAPHEGERRYAGQYRPAGQDFNPRSPRGGAT